MSSLRRNQLLGVLGAAPAVAIAIAVWLNAPQIFAHVPLPANDPGSRLAFAAQWLVIPGLTLLAGILGASRRGFYADAIEGTRTPKSQSLEINLRYNQNTIEQTLLAAIAWFGLARMLPHEQLALIPALAVLFAIGRATFWIGYALHPMGRTFGISLTAFPTIIAYSALVWDFAT
jgi:hypothetical protein